MLGPVGLKKPPQSESKGESENTNTSSNTKKVEKVEIVDMTGGIKTPPTINKKEHPDKNKDKGNNNKNFDDPDILVYFLIVECTFL